MRARKWAGGSRIGVRAKPAPSVAGVHLSIMIPLGTSMNARRIGRAGCAAKAAVMASSTGKARLAPVPRKKVRRGMDFFRIATALPPPILKGLALTLPRKNEDQ